MSTKSTLVYGGTFHLYTECFDDNNVWLELQKPEFEVTQDHLVVGIPNHIWEHVRQRTNYDVSMADKTDEELEVMVRKLVDDRIKFVTEAEEKSGEKSSVLRIMGAMVIGLYEEPIAEQLEHGMRECKRTRDEHQRRLAAFKAIDDYRNGLTSKKKVVPDGGDKIANA